MSPDIEFEYNKTIFETPAPILEAEWRSPFSPNAQNPETLPTLIDSGADGCALPPSIINKLKLRQVDETWVGGYDDKDEEMEKKPVYSAHLTIPSLESIVVEVIPKYTEGYAIIGREIINAWVLTLDGPKLKAYLKLKS